MILTEMYLSSSVLIDTVAPTSGGAIDTTSGDVMDTVAPTSGDGWAQLEELELEGGGWEELEELDVGVATGVCFDFSCFTLLCIFF